MRKHILIGIPCVLLHLISFSGLMFSLNAWYSQSSAVAMIGDLKPRGMGSERALTQNAQLADDVSSLASATLQSAEDNLTLYHQSPELAWSSAQEHSLVFAAMFGFSLALSIVLIAGLMPMFRKSSNK